MVKNNLIEGLHYAVRVAEAGMEGNNDLIIGEHYEEVISAFLFGTKNSLAVRHI